MLKCTTKFHHNDAIIIIYDHNINLFIWCSKILLLSSRICPIFFVCIHECGWNIPFHPIPGSDAPAGRYKEVEVMGEFKWALLSRNYCWEFLMPGIMSLLWKVLESNQERVGSDCKANIRNSPLPPQKNEKRSRSEVKEQCLILKIKFELNKQKKFSKMLEWRGACSC